MKAKWMLPILCVLIFNVTTASFAYVDFDDVSDDIWYSDWVYIVSELDVVSGYHDGTYKPDNEILRIELLSMVLKAIGYDIPISKEYWGQNILDKAVELNIITAQSFDAVYSNPDDCITREEAARVIYNAYLIDSDINNSDVAKKITSQLSDINDVGALYKSAVIGVLAEGIVSGYENNTFKPQASLTRAEASVLITRLLLPEKRAVVDIDLPLYEFESTSVGAENFITYFSEDHRDIYNIMTIITFLENKITAKGFAVAKELNLQNSHEIDLYNSLSKFDQTSNLSSDWHILLRKNPSNAEYTGDIEITTSRLNSNDIYDESITGLFNYLFAEDAERILSKIEYYRNFEVAEDESYEYVTSAFNRNVMIIITPNEIKLLISKEENMLPVIINDGKLNINYNGTFSDGAEATVHYSDVADINSGGWEDTKESEGFTYTDVCLDTAQDLINEKANLVILDVRIVEEFNEGSLKNAINIPHDQLESRLSELDVTQEVLVFCKLGSRSLIASEILASNGYIIYNMYEGYQGYINQ